MTSFKRDDNHIPVSGGVYDDGSNTIAPFQVDSSTGRLKISATVSGGSGNVVGPASATDNAIARFDGTTGKLIQNSVVLVGDTGAVTGVTTLTLDTLNATTKIAPVSNDGAPLGDTTHNFSDLFLASGGIINWNNGDVTITHGSNILTFAGASTGYYFDTLIAPTADDGGALGLAANSWSDLFLASGALINIANGNWVATHSSGILTVSTGDLRVTTAGTNSASVVTVGGTQTITSKRITKRVVTVTQSATPTINTDNTDVAYITGLAQAVTSFTTNLSGTPVNGDTLIIDVTDNGTGRALTFGASFEASGNVALPTTTIANTKLTIGFRWNVATTKWTCVAVA